MNIPNDSQTDKNSLEEFAEKLLVEKGVGEMDAEIRQQMKKDLVDRLEDRINATILEKMPPEKLEEFEKLVDAPSQEEMTKFCAENIPDLDQMIAAELVSFRTTYLATG
ncbi:MAG: DUF5663 domain-containing protein [Candidatus Shapirobacteria bacterium]